MTKPNPENAVKDLVSFLPVLAYDGANMTQIDAGGIYDYSIDDKAHAGLCPALMETGDAHA